MLLVILGGQLVEMMKNRNYEVERHEDILLRLRCENLEEKCFFLASVQYVQQTNKFLTKFWKFLKAIIYTKLHTDNG